MTPEQFQHDALAWVQAIGTVGLFVIGTVAGLWAAYKSKVQQFQIDNNTARLNGHADQIDNLMMSVTPPAPAGAGTTVINQPNAQVTENAPPTPDPEATAPNP